MNKDVYLISGAALIVISSVAGLLIILMGPAWATSVGVRLFPSIIHYFNLSNWFYPYEFLWAFGALLLIAYWYSVRAEAEIRERMEDELNRVRFERAESKLEPVSLSSSLQEREEKRERRADVEKKDDISVALRDALIAAIREGKIEVNVDAEIPIPEKALGAGSRGVIRLRSASSQDNTIEERQTEEEEKKLPLAERDETE